MKGGNVIKQSNKTISTIFQELTEFEKGTKITISSDSATYYLTLFSANSFTGFITGINQDHQYMAIHCDAIVSYEVGTPSPTIILTPEDAYTLTAGDTIALITVDAMALNEDSDLVISYYNSPLFVHLSANKRTTEQIYLPVPIPSQEVQLQSSNHPIELFDIQFNSQPSNWIKSGSYYTLPVKPNMEAVSISVNWYDCGQGAKGQLFLNDEAYENPIDIPDSLEQFTWNFPPRVLSSAKIKIVDAEAYVSV